VASDASRFASVLGRLQRDQGAQVSVKFVPATGTTGLNILPIRPGMVTVTEQHAEILLPHGLGRLTLHAQDLSAVRSIPASDTWRLEFGPLVIIIEFGGPP
jgi:hypothetical protein